MNLIQNQIGPRRNRFVHDDWYVADEKMVRIDKRPKIQKAESFSEPKLVHESARVTDAAEVYDLVGLVTDVMTHIIFMGLGYAKWRKDGLPPAVPEQVFELGKYGFLEPPQGDVPKPVLNALLSPE